MVNGYPPWAAYRSLMLGRLIGLDKFPGVMPVCVGETLRRMLEKCMLLVTGAEAKEACRTEQLCGGPEAGTEGGIQAVRIMWQQHDKEEKWGFLLIDTEMHSMKRTAYPCY